MSKSKMEILTELPMRGKYINWKEAVGMTIEVEHEDYGLARFKVIDYYNKNNKLYITLDYNKYVLDGGIRVDRFLKGQIGGVMNIANSSKNTFHLDDNNILHIYGENKNGKWEVLYSGNHIEEVMNSTWYVNENKISTNSFNFNGKSKLLHHVDIKPGSHMVIDHISNPYNLIDKFYDNRIENLREIIRAENNRNRKCKNEWGYTGLVKRRNGWCSIFKYNGVSICTKTEHDLNECILDNLIAQRYLGYKHQKEEFRRLDGLSEDRIKEVADWLDERIKKVDNKIHDVKEYNHDIEQKDGYYILRKNGHEMLFDCDLEYIKDKFICPIVKSNGVYWSITYLKNNKKIQNRFHRDILGLNSNEYLEYKIHIDHLNNNPSDNRFNNLAVTTHYSNNCNKSGLGYSQTMSNGYEVKYMKNYKFWYLIGGVKRPIFKTEQEAIAEVSRRKLIIDNARVKLKTKQELDELIQYCLDNQYILENGLANLDLGYLYWKGILEVNKVA